MDSLKRKLRNQDGVSLLIALVGFMVAAMISIVIVSAAVTSAERVADDTKENQTHLTLESAAQVVRDGMEDTTCICTMSDGKLYPVSAEGMFKKEVQQLITAVESKSLGNPTDPIDLTLQVSASTDKIEDVSVEMVMKNKGSDDSGDGEKYYIFFTFHTEDSDQNLYLKMTAKKDPDAGGQYKLSWSSISISSINSLGD